MARWHADVAARRLTYENARRIHEGWYAEDYDEAIGPSGTDDPWEVMPCGHMAGELHCGEA
jgi:hypothetical protein